jgi:hypothetical protein
LFLAEEEIGTEQLKAAIRKQVHTTTSAKALEGKGEEGYECPDHMALSHRTVRELGRGLHAGQRMHLGGLYVSPMSCTDMLICRVLCCAVWCVVSCVVWCGVVWCGVLYCVVWCGVVWCGVVGVDDRAQVRAGVHGVGLQEQGRAAAPRRRPRLPAQPHTGTHTQRHEHI